LPNSSLSRWTASCSLATIGCTLAPARESRPVKHASGRRNGPGPCRFAAALA
jgi:hypothetical protein